MGNTFFEFNEIKHRIASDPRGYLAECDHILNGQITRAAAKIATQANTRPVVLLAGPSGSGKTTTAYKLAEELQWIGVGAHVVSMDDYFRTVTEYHPRNHKGEIDYESPDCLDIPLLTEHFAALIAGDEVQLPYFDFQNQRRDEAQSKPLHLQKNEVAIFEGIHALNPQLLRGPKDSSLAESEWRLYVSARSNVREGPALMYKGTWIRLTRRLIRDAKFRGWPGETTLRIWANVRRGEKRHISPYSASADITIDTALAYELPVLRDYALPLLRSIPEDADRAAELCQIAPLLEQFPPLPEVLVSKRSLIREFIG